jgi:hypothetical protein
MEHLESILSSKGYEVRCEELRKERGSDASKHWIATKGGVEHFAFKIGGPDCAHDRPDHYRRIRSIQDSIPRMARMIGPFEDIVLLERCHPHARKLWEMDDAPDYAGVVECQLIEFALGTRSNQLVHGDLRPWNVFFDINHGVQVIDWWCLSSFVDDLVGDLPRRRDLIEEGKHYVKFHPDLVAQRNFTEIDLTDARLVGRLLRGEIGRLSQAWPQTDPRPWYPLWCKH